MTISKSQGQTLDFVGLWLNEPFFTHWQLYIALSRVSSPHNIKIALNNVNKTTRNVVYKQVLFNII
jgi:ATP-dependent exoDNAse (exonuclease V) alpha subunit